MPHPNLTRKDFLKSAALAALAATLPKVSPAMAAAIGVTEIAPGIFVHKGQYAHSNAENVGDIANATIIAGADALAVIDTGGSARIGSGLLEAARAISSKPIRYVINTHMHPDHVFGNAAFSKEGAEIVAHHKMARGLSARAQNYLRANAEALGAEGFAGTEIVMPTKPVQETGTLDLGGRVLELKARPTAHTDNDLTVLDQATGTLVLGDLLFAERIPTIDGSLTGWLKLIETMKGESAQRAVPGHGPVSLPWPGALDPMQHYLSTLADDVRALIKAGKTIEDATKSAGQSEKDKWALFSEDHVRNATAAFAELEWE
jgi:quinoprotein relay system zinc metallohydrolase 2